MMETGQGKFKTDLSDFDKALGMGPKIDSSQDRAMSSVDLDGLAAEVE